MQTLKKNITIYYTISFLSACIFTTPIWAFFFTSYHQFSFPTALNLMILSGIVSFIFEIPSGAWADKFGRKKMYLLGITLAIISFGMWAFIESIYLFIFSAVINGIAFAITSGNLEVLIHDSLEENKQESKFKNIHSNAYISIFLGRAFSSVIAGYLFIANPLLPIHATVISYIFIFFLTLLIGDGKQQGLSGKNTKSHIKQGIIFLYDNSFLLSFIIIMAIITGIGNLYWFSYQPYLKEIGISIENIGIIFAITGLFSALGAQTIKKLQSIFPPKHILLIILTLSLIASIFMQFFNIYGAILGIVMTSFIAGFLMSFGNNILIQKSPKTHKSTILSIFSFAITIGYASFAIVSGYSIESFGLFYTYLGNIFITFFLLSFTLFFVKDEK